MGTILKLALVLIILLLLTSIVAVAACPSGQCFVTTGGSGSTCSSGTPGTLQNCIGIAVAGDTVNVAAGTYNVNPGNGGGTGIFNSNSGSSGNPITITSTTPLGAIINENNSCTAGNCNDIIWEEDGNWLVIQGFKIMGHARIGLLTIGNHNVIKQNWVTALSGIDDSCNTGTAAIDDGYTGTTGSTTIDANLVTSIGDQTTASCAAGIYVQKNNDIVENNIIGHMHGGVGIQTWHAGTAATFINNTVFNTGEGISIGCGDAGCTSSNNNVVRNNIVMGNAVGIAASGTFGITGGTCTTYDHNIVYNNTTNYQNNSTGLTGAGNMQGCAGAGTGDKTTNPTMINYQSDGTGNYQAAGISSPQVDAGSSSLAPNHDFALNARSDVPGTNPDIGAYELNTVPPPSTPPTQANLWVGASGSCTRSSTLVSYNAATSCVSIQAAITKAFGGDTVLILNGTYGAQTINANQPASTVSVWAQTYGSVLLTGGLTVDVDHIHIIGVTEANGASDSSGGLTIINGTSTSWTDIVVDGFHGKNAFIAATGVTVKNSEFGNWSACSGYVAPSTCTGDCAIEDGFRFWSWGPGSTLQPANDTILDSSIHDVSGGSGGNCGGGAGVPHVDAIQVYSGGTNITIDGVIFYNNATSAIQAGGGTLSNWTIQNNYFGQTTCCNNIVWGQATTSGSLIIRNNTFVNTNGYAVVNDGSASGAYTLDYTNNLWLSSAPSSGSAVQAITGSNNVFPVSGGSTYGTSATRCAPTYTSGGVPASGNGYNQAIASSDTCVQDKGTASDYAPTDIAGTTRFLGTAPDVGPFEVTGAAPPTNCRATLAHVGP